MQHLQHSDSTALIPVFAPVRPIMLVQVLHPVCWLRLDAIAANRWHLWQRSEIPLAQQRALSPWTPVLFRQQLCCTR